MKNRYFLTGMLAATIGVAGLFSINSIQASGSRLDKEIKFARQIGIYDSTSYSSHMLNRPIAELAYYRGLSSVLFELGIIESTSMDEMRRLGIMPTDTGKKSISRKASVEAIFRAVSFGLENDLIDKTNDSHTFQPFYDWIIEEKYMSSLAIVIDRGIIKGMPNGRFCPDTSLKTADALVLFKRIYDAFSGNEEIAGQPQDEAAQSGALSLERLQKAGAFSQIKCNIDFENDRRIRLQDLNIMLQGILSQAELPAYITELKYLTRNMNPKKSVSRATLAHLAAVMVRALPVSATDNKIIYADVSPNSGLARALAFLGQVGIKMGYENNLLKGKELVSASEAISLIDRILEKTQRTRTEKAATRNDFEEFKALIEARKARIRRILNRS
jgi:hypothetical protein